MLTSVINNYKKYSILWKSFFSLVSNLTLTYILVILVSDIVNLTPIVIVIYLTFIFVLFDYFKNSR